jgi:hypothetical protein
VSDRGIREITLSVFYEKRDDFDPLLDDIEWEPDNNKKREPLQNGSRSSFL